MCPAGFNPAYIGMDKALPWIAANATSFEALHLLGGAGQLFNAHTWNADIGSGSSDVLAGRRTGHALVVGGATASGINENRLADD